MTPELLLYEAGILVTKATESVDSFVQSQGASAEAAVWGATYAACRSRDLDRGTHEVASQEADEALRAWRDRGNRGL